MYGALERMRAASGVIERRERLSRDEFFEQYYFQNRPVIITCAFVEVQFGRESDASYEINQPKANRVMRFADYVDRVERSGPLTKKRSASFHRHTGRA